MTLIIKLIVAEYKRGLKMPSSKTDRDFLRELKKKDKKRRKLKKRRRHRSDSSSESSDSDGSDLDLSKVGRIDIQGVQ